MARTGQECERTREDKTGAEERETGGNGGTGTEREGTELMGRTGAEDERIEDKTEGPRTAAATWARATAATEATGATTAAATLPLPCPLN